MDGGEGDESIQDKIDELNELIEIMIKYCKKNKS